MDGVSSAAIEVLLQNLISAVKEEYFLIKGLKKDAEQLQTTLEIIQGYLIDAEKKSISHDAVKVWLRKVEAVAFDADNVLDEFSYHLLRKKVEKMMMPQPKKKVLSSCLNSITGQRKMALKIKKINADFDSMDKKATKLSLQIIVANTPAAPPNAPPETNSFTLDPVFIGRDDDVSQLVKELTNIPQEEKLIHHILAIVGMGGMGKTTLTRKLFNDEKVKDRFGSHVWVHVSQTFDPIILFKKILSALTLQTSDGVESDVILKKLQEAWKGKTYLLVLDDVWNEDLPKWEHFIDSISGVTSTNGNAIIITTRKDYVASVVRPLHIHPLKGLSNEECWSIIKAKAFENGDVLSEGFEMIGREIAKRCQGLPLAANVVGGVLFPCKLEEEWRSINEKWVVSDGEGGENISKILKLSYDYLSSPSLKKCFAYCSIFPKGTQIKRQVLIEQWMAEGFLHGDERNDMESVGNKFFNVLLHNSLLLVGGVLYKNEEFYVMHDLVHDMASSVLGYSNSIADGITPVRYLTLKQYSPIPKQVAEHLHSLVFEGRNTGNMLEDLKYLHVLTLRGYYRVEGLPNSIRKMIHLRNLNISNTWIEKLPDWIGELYHLQTLRAKRLKELPSTLKYLINLRHLYVHSDAELPAEIGRLICLQRLPHFRVGDEKGYKIEELGSLNNLKGEMRISNLEKVHGKEEALKANIFQKPNLYDLRLDWGSSVRREGETLNDESVLEGLQPHPNLKKLGIYGFKGRRIPLWSKKMAVRDGPQGSNCVPLHNLIEITISYCEECEEIPMLEHLPNLKSLSLVGLKKVRCINSSFNNLTSLNIEYLEGLECLPHRLFYNNSNLSELTIWKCPKLRELPDGLNTLNSMEKLTIEDCQNLRSIGNPSGGQSRGILRYLQIEGCGLECLPNWLFYNNQNLSELKIKDCPNLIEITLSYCEECEEIPMLEHLPNLKSLSLIGLKKARFINSSFNNLTSLNIKYLEGLECLPDWLLYNNQNLSKIWISGCPKLRELPDGLHTLNSLEEFIISECPILKSIGNPSGGVGQPQGILHKLCIERCGGLMELPRQMVECWAPSLETLQLKELSSLENLPMLIDCLAKSTCLNYLEIVGVPKLMAACTVESWDLGSLGRLEIDVSKEWSMESSDAIVETVNGILQGCCNSLHSFTLKGIENWEWLPESIKHLTALSYLKIENSGVEELPQWFGNRSSLEVLTLHNCKKLRCMPSGNALENLAELRYLTITDCPELLIDSEWRNIPHLAITVDGDRIQSCS